MLSILPCHVSVPGEGYLQNINNTVTWEKIKRNLIDKLHQWSEPCLGIERRIWRKSLCIGHWTLCTRFSPSCAMLELPTTRISSGHFVWNSCVVRFRKSGPMYCRVTSRFWKQSTYFKGKGNVLNILLNYLSDTQMSLKHHHRACCPGLFRQSTKCYREEVICKCL